MGYISTIKTAVQLFPFLAFLLTLPYMILNYRKYGSVNKLRVLIFYSFMLYLMTVYLLVILPLPDPSKIHTSYSEMVNLHPFAFVVDFFKEYLYSCTMKIPGPTLSFYNEADALK